MNNLCYQIKYKRQINVLEWDRFASIYSGVEIGSHAQASQNHAKQKHIYASDLTQQTYMYID